MTWHVAADADALREAEAKAVKVADREIALCLIDGECFAVGNICTHQHAYLSDGYVEDGCIECPLHQGRFDLKTGAALAAPVTEPVRVFRMREDGGKAYIEISEEPAR